MENFPHVAGKLVAEMDELMDGLGLEGDRAMGKEKFCTSLNLPGRPGLGIMESGDDWKGPITDWIMSMGKGPMYLPLEISFCTISRNSEWYVSKDGEFLGDWVCMILGKSTLKPNWSPVGMLPKRSRRLAWRRAASHASGL
jgi:hypothetical protein